MAEQGTLSWQLSAHPITLLVFLAFRIAALLTYLFGLLFTSNFVLIFIIVILLLSVDFYFLKNIAGRRLVGLRWWNETDPATGASHLVFESPPDPDVDPTFPKLTATDARFFWLAIYLAPVLWLALAFVAIVRLEFIWLSLVIIALVLCGTNGVAFSRADRFRSAESFAGRAMGGGLATRFARGFVERMFTSSSR
ncbi:putative clathrin-coated vesicle protein [Peziza echinospora]|nr:putative clathrin-coated vesicle protein [Peziza echinospora]